MALLMEARQVRAVLVVAPAGIDEDRVMAGAHDEGVHRGAEAVLREVEEFRHHPRLVLGERLARERREKLLRPEAGLHRFLHPYDFGAAYRPPHQRYSISVSRFPPILRDRRSFAVGF